uniref:tetratricopeptide repeat-containing diguanylate cyclase n=1 Tax=Acetatifactor sp. TaxID=1872090 RepID=UPI0040574834
MGEYAFKNKVVMVVVQDIEKLIGITDALEQKLRASQKLKWEDIQNAMNCITEKQDKGLYGLVCFYGAYYLLSNGRRDECLYYINESIRCVEGTPQENAMARCYNLSGVVAHSQGNFVLAMEHYEKALLYARRYNRQLVASMINSNKADTYYRVGAYNKAMECYRECLMQLQRFCKITSRGENMYIKTLANCGYCLIYRDTISEAEAVEEELQKYLANHSMESVTVKLAVYTFLALLASCKKDIGKADQYTAFAVQAALEECTISVDYDSILNLIQYLIRTGRTHSLQMVLDCMEPQAAIEKNEGFLLQLLLYRLQYCSEDMDHESFLKCTQTFFGLKNKHEFAENNQVLRMISLRNKLQEIEKEQAKLVEENSRLLYQTKHDELTGLYNKRYLSRRMEEMFEEALEKERALGIMFVDIDYFKQMNDRYGHQKGDDCILTIAEGIKYCMPEDFAARYGGDEFVIITLGRTREYMEEKAQMLVDYVKEQRIPNENSKFMKILTITVGAVHAVPHKPNKVWDFLTVADETLYYQKNEQKGQVRFYVGQGECL